MTKPVARSEYPLWVKLSLFGVPNRAGVRMFVALSLAAAIASIIYGFKDSRMFYVAVLMLIAGGLYWSAIKWVDKHGSWGEPR